MSRIINFCADYLSMSDSAEIGNKGGENRIHKMEREE